MKPIFLLGLLLMLPFSDVPFTRKFQAGEKLLISAPVDHDVYAAAEKITVQAAIGGDLMAAGGTVEVRGRIRGDLLLAGGEVVVDGRVGENLLVMGGEVRILQPVQGDLIVMGGEVTVDRQVTIGQDLVIMAGQACVHGEVKGNILARGGDLDMRGVCLGNLQMQGGEISVNGTVRGPAQLAAESIILKTEAQFYDNVQYWVADRETISFAQALKEGATASYDATLNLEEESFWLTPSIGWLPFILVYLFSVLLLIMLLYALLPDMMERSGRILNQETIRSFGYGVLYFIGAPLAVALLLMSMVGVPLGLFLLFLYVFSIMFSLSLSAVVIACLIHERYHFHWRRSGFVLVSFGIFLVLRLFSLIPFAGLILAILVVGACFGAFILAASDRQKALHA